jgi:hypothetical protein
MTAYDIIITARTASSRRLLVAGQSYTNRTVVCNENATSMTVTPSAGCPSANCIIDLAAAGATSGIGTIIIIPKTTSVTLSGAVCLPTAQIFVAADGADSIHVKIVPAAVEIEEARSLTMFIVIFVALVLFMSIVAVRLVPSCVRWLTAAKEALKNMERKGALSILRGTSKFRVMDNDNGHLTNDGTRMRKVMVIAGGGFVFAMVYAVMQYESDVTYSSNLTAVGAFYNSKMCNGSAFLTTLPSAAIGVPVTEVCTPVQVVGIAQGLQAAVAQCTLDGSGTYTAKMFVSTTNGCKNPEEKLETATVFPAGTCVDVTTIGVELDHAPARYVIVTCTVNTEAAHYLAKLSALGVAGQNYSTLDARPQGHAALKRNTTNENGMLRHIAPFVVSSKIQHATSVGDRRMATVADKASFIGAIDGLRIVLQTNETLRQTPGGYTTSIEDSLVGVIQNMPLENITDMTPTSNDYPLGFLYGGLGSRNEVSGSSAASLSHRYFHMRDSDFDVGKWYGAKDDNQYRGFTISLWMRATNSTNGFAFLLADHFEDAGSKASHVAEKLLKFSDGDNDEVKVWFDKSWHVYSSLYVDGARGTLRYTYADPESSGFGKDSIVSTSWNMEDTVDETTGQPKHNVFNGQWHHIQITLRNDFDERYAVIALDGYSETQSRLYRKCVPRRTTPIQTNLKPEIGIKYDPTLATSTDGAVMYVGYFNGGVNSLQFVPERRDASSAVRDGTREMYLHNAKRKTSILMIAIYLVGCGVIMIIPIWFMARGADAVDPDVLHKVKSQKELRYECLSEFYYPKGYRRLKFNAVMRYMDAVLGGEIRKDFADRQELLKDERNQAREEDLAREAKKKEKRLAKMDRELVRELGLDAEVLDDFDYDQPVEETQEQKKLRENDMFFWEELCLSVFDEISTSTYMEDRARLVYDDKKRELYKLVKVLWSKRHAVDDELDEDEQKKREKRMERHATARRKEIDALLKEEKAQAEAAAQADEERTQREADGADPFAEEQEQEQEEEPAGGAPEEQPRSAAASEHNSPKSASGDGTLQEDVDPESATEADGADGAEVEPIPTPPAADAEQLDEAEDEGGESMHATADDEADDSDGAATAVAVEIELSPEELSAKEKEREAMLDSLYPTNAEEWNAAFPASDFLPLPGDVDYDEEKQRPDGVSGQEPQARHSLSGGKNTSNGTALQAIGSLQVLGVFFANVSTPSVFDKTFGPFFDFIGNFVEALLPVAGATMIFAVTGIAVLVVVTVVLLFHVDRERFVMIVKMYASKRDGMAEHEAETNLLVQNAADGYEPIQFGASPKSNDDDTVALGASAFSASATAARGHHMHAGVPRHMKMWSVPELIETDSDDSDGDTDYTYTDDGSEFDIIHSDQTDFNEPYDAAHKVDGDRVDAEQVRVQFVDGDGEPQTGTETVPPAPVVEASLFYDAVDGADGDHPRRHDREKHETALPQEHHAHAVPRDPSEAFDPDSDPTDDTSSMPEATETATTPPEASDKLQSGSMSPDSPSSPRMKDIPDDVSDTEILQEAHSAVHRACEEGNKQVLLAAEARCTLQLIQQEMKALPCGREAVEDDNFNVLYRGISFRPDCVAVDERKEVTMRAAADDMHDMHKIPAIAARCPKHDVLLVPIPYTEITPFMDRRACCAEVETIQSTRQTCLLSVGTLNVCPHRDEETDATCAYALCAQHTMVPPLDGIKLLLNGIKYMQTRNGVFGIFSFIIILIVIIQYVATMQLCVMVMACHPRFHCVFPQCGFGNGDATYDNAFGLAVLVMIAYGVMLPVVFWREMRVRQESLRDVFLGEQYGVKYIDLTNSVDAIAQDYVNCRTTKASMLFGAVHPADFKMEPTKDQIRRQNAAIAGITLPPKTRVATALDVIDPKEWNRYLNADDTTLARHYDQMTYEGMPLVPVAHFLKAILVIVPLTTEPNSFTQLFLMMIGETIFLIFNAMGLPYSNDWTKVVALASSCHHFFIIGVQAYYVSQLLEPTQNEDTIGYIMIALTVVYLIIIIWRILADTITPIVLGILRTKAINKVFMTHGLTMPSLAPVWVIPTHVTRVMRDMISDANDAMEAADVDVVDHPLDVADDDAPRVDSVMDSVMDSCILRDTEQSP